MSAPHFTILAPWLSDTDWSGNLCSYFQRLLGGGNCNVVYSPCQYDPASSFGWLVPKMDISVRMLDSAMAGEFGGNVLVIDPNYVNIRALRYLVGNKGRIISLVHGGAFQKYDLETQYVEKWNPAKRRYEEGYFGLVDRIVLPSKHAKKIFSSQYRSLTRKITVIPYPVKNIPDGKASCQERNGIVVPCRNSYEKGSDVIASLLNSSKLNITRMQNLRQKEYFECVAGAMLTLIPSRADLYGMAAIESIYAGTIPVVPFAFSYPEYIKLPRNLFLSHPIGRATCKEIISVYNKISSFSTDEYREVISVAKSHLAKRLRGMDSKFLMELQNLRQQGAI